MSAEREQGAAKIAVGCTIGCRRGVAKRNVSVPRAGIQSYNPLLPPAPCSLPPAPCSASSQATDTARRYRAAMNAIALRTASLALTLLALDGISPLQANQSTPDAVATRPTPPASVAPASPAAPAVTFRSELVEFPGGAPDVTLAGTLLLPATARPDAKVAAVILVTGSGPQDRDESLMGRRPFKVLAEGLVARGFAVLRYDDRGTKGLGIGASTGSFAGATLADFATDAAAAVAFAASRPEIDSRRLVLCGHSTGGLETAMILGGTNSLAAAVLLAAPAVRGDALLAHQSAAILRKTHDLGRSGLKDDQLEAAINAQNQLVHAAAGDDSAAMIAAAEEAVRVTMSIQAPGATLTEEQRAKGVDQALTPLREPWMAHFLRYDPAADLAASSVPVLAIFGGRDIQVAPELNVMPVVTALGKAGHPGSTVVVIPTSNHLFQTASTGLLDEYGQLNDEMDFGLQSVIAEWLDLALGQSRGAGTGGGT